KWRAQRIDAGKAAAIEARFTARFAAAPERFREQAPAPGGRAAALRLIEQLQQSTPADAQTTAQFGEAVRLKLPQLRNMLSALGPLQSLFFRGVGPFGFDIYAAQFANGSADFRLGLAADGTIEDLLFRPNGDGRPGEVIACAQEPSLKPEAGAVPIRLILFNGSGAEVRLFDLGGEGTRKAQGTVGDSRIGSVLTHVGQPLIVADAASNCLGIVLPGVVTRFLRVQPERGAELSVITGRTRVMPRAGSEEALHRYIEAIARGEPPYDEMTEEAAAEARQDLLVERAILARLGPLRAMSFRTATVLDSDIYMAQFANGAAEWRIRLLDDGRIAGIALGPQY
ncbi:MAG TPA: hypothetical protein VK456_00340, partial [Xanthobacteraceae bacterium]|nr:hypothetical protein [Xanthobacteraceae bacterium]